MAYLSRKSKENRDECHNYLKELINRSIEYDDFSVGEAHRDRETHEQYRREGKSKIPYEKTKHRLNPSHAVHLIPYPTGWPDNGDDVDALHQFYQLHGVAKTVWKQMKDEGVVPPRVRLRWGGDWDGDDIFSDQEFDDLAHYEIVGI